MDTEPDLLNEQVETALASTAALGTRSSAMARNALSGYLPLLTTLLSGLLLTPLLVRGLGEVRFGIWSFGVAALGFLGLVDSGVGTAVVTRVANATGKDEVHRVTRAASWLYSVAAGLTVAAGVVLIWLSPHLLHAPGDVAEMRAMFALLVVVQIVGLFACVPSGFLQGTGRYSTLAVAGAATGFIGAIAQAVLAETTHRVEPVAAAMLLTAAIQLVIYHWRSRRYDEGYSLSSHGADRASARWLLRLGSRNAVIYIAGSVGYGSDLVVVGAVCGARDAAVYAVGSRAALFARSLATRVSDSLSGNFAALGSADQFDRAWALYLRSLRVAMVILAPLTISLVSFGRPILSTWVGNTGPSSYEVLVLLLIGGIAQLVGYGAFILVVASERSSRLTRISVLSGVGNIALSIGLAFAVGRTGPAWGSLAAATVVDLVMFPRIAASICQQSAPSILAVVRPLAFPVALQIIACLAMTRLSNLNDLQACAAATLAVGLFFAACTGSRALRYELRDILAATRNRPSDD